MKGYIFDLFGTLVTDDKWKPWDILLEEVLGEIDLKLRKEIMNKKDYGSDKICLETLKTKNNSNWSNKKDQKILQTFKRWRDAQIFYPATKKTLIELRKRGYKLGIVSNNNNLCEDVIYRLELDKLIDVTILSHKVGYRKPEQEIYKICAKKWD